MAAEFPPARRQLGGAGIIQREELGSERLRPDREDSLDAIASEPRGDHCGFGQAAPGSFSGIVR